MRGTHTWPLSYAQWGEKNYNILPFFALVISRDFYETFLVLILEEYFMKTQIHQTERKFKLGIRPFEVSLSPKRLNFLTEIAKFGFLK